MPGMPDGVSPTCQRAPGVGHAQWHGRPKGPPLHDDTPAPPAAVPHRQPHLPALLSLALTVGTINGLSRVAMPLYAAASGAQAPLTAVPAALCRGS